MGTHALLSPSSAHRWLECPASVKLEEGFPDTSSDAAREGSAAHELGESCLVNSTNAEDYIGYAFPEYPDFPVTEDMAEYVQAYVDYVRSLQGELLVEKRVDYSAWVEDGNGTSDAIVLGSEVNTIIDLKYGRNKVFAKNNPQAMMYALGVYNDFGFLMTSEVFKVVIVQPRLDHIDEWEITLSELLEWAEDVKQKALLTQSDDAPFNPGEKQCQWCKAKAVCKPLATQNMELIFQDFEGFDSIEGVLEPQNVDYLTLAQLATALDHLKLIESWIAQVRAITLSKAHLGEEIPTYKLVEQKGRNSRNWADLAKAERAIKKVLKEKEIDIKQKPISELLSVAKIEKIIGKKDPLFEKHVATIQGDSKTILVHESDDRPAANADVINDFDEIA